MRETLNFLQKVVGRYEKLPAEEISRILDQLSKDFDIFSMIMDNLKEGVVALNKEQQILSYNKQASLLLHLPQSAKGQKLLDVLANSPFHKPIAEGIENESEVDEAVIHDDSGNRILLIKTLPLAKYGSIKGLLILISDITEERRKEDELKRAEQLAGLTTLAAGVAHEIKNPLGSLDIHIQLIERVCKRMQQSDEREEIMGFIKTVKEEVSRLEDTVNGFLFSVRKLKLEVKKKDIRSVLTGTLNFLQYEIKEHDVDVELQYEEDLPEIEIDEKYIKQALINVIQNAIDALKDNKGKKSILIELKTDKDKSAVSLSVMDNGKGISKEDSHKIFEPYYTTKQFGTGLGLTNVYRIIEAHNGSISIKNNIGSEEGVTVIISLPASRHAHRLLTDGEGRDAIDSDS